MLKLKKKYILRRTRFGYKNFFISGRSGGVGPPSVNLGNISKSKWVRKLKLKTPLDIVTYSPWVQKKFPLGGVQGSTGLPSVNLGPP